MFKLNCVRGSSTTPAQHRLRLGAEIIRALTSKDLQLVAAGFCDTASVNTKRPPDQGGCD